MKKIILAAMAMMTMASAANAWVLYVYTSDGATDLGQYYETGDSCLAEMNAWHSAFITAGWKHQGQKNNENGFIYTLVNPSNGVDGFIICSLNPLT